MSLKERIYQFMQGRYGSDELNRFLLAVIIAGIILQVMTGAYVLNIFTLLLTIIVLFRCFSKNISARSAENRRYLTIIEPIKIWFRNMFGKSEFKIYLCPNCRQKMRVPKGRGKIEIKCPKCGSTFIKRS